jgi:hypothetical protein
MTTVAEHMESTSISAQTPDGIAFATIRGDRDVTFSLVPGSGVKSGDVVYDG